MRVLVIANGLMDDPSVEVAAWHRAGDLVVAADGGSYHALAAGLTPHHVVGDLDSLSGDLQECWRSAGTVFHPASVDKDETDLELALMWAASQPGVRQIVVLGAFGGRPDQALANLLLLGLPALARRRVSMVTGAWVVAVVRGGEQLHLSGHPGDCVSLIPLGGRAEGVTTAGLVFPLREEVLAFGPARGVSNRMEGNRATVSLCEGLLWCFHQRQAGSPEGEPA